MRGRATHRWTAAAAIAAGLVLPPVTLVAEPGAAQTPADATAQTPAETTAQTPVETTAFESSRFRYAVALPVGCRRDEGPGTVDAVCSADFDAEKSASASKATALLLSVGAEALSADGDMSVDALRQHHGEARFKDELPEAVCGESDKARVKIENVKETVEEGRLVYAADVVCAPVKFLRIPERRASVRHVIAPDMRYRLIARAPTEDFKKQRATIDAFFASFRTPPAESAPVAGKVNQ